MRSVVPLFHRHSARRIVSVPDDQTNATAQALDWPGLLLEAGRNDVAEVDELRLAHHFVGVNADPAPITIEIKDAHGYRQVRLGPGEGWFNPAGEPMSLRVQRPRGHAYVRVTIEPSRFERLVATRSDGDSPIALRRRYGIGGKQLQHVLAALAAEAGAGTPSGLLFVDALAAALALQLVHQAGVSEPYVDRARGGLAPAVRRRILELMDARADDTLTLTELAGEAGLSPTHFARAFKESVGRAPHQHLIAVRLERARRLLESPQAALSDVAARAGFADQAHLTRLFKRQFGVTPGAFAQRSRLTRIDVRDVQP
jgi:AraC family transcriptional regulator